MYIIAGILYYLFVFDICYKEYKKYNTMQIYLFVITSILFLPSGFLVEIYREFKNLIMKK
jgi:hypothetical protein